MSAKPQRHSRPQCWRDSHLDFQMLRVSQHVQVDSFMRRYTKFLKHVCEKKHFGRVSSSTEKPAQAR